MSGLRFWGCPDCGERLARSARLCPHCGARVTPTDQEPTFSEDMLSEEPPEQKAARKAQLQEEVRKPSLFRLFMFILGVLICARGVFTSGGNWMTILLTLVFSIVAYWEIKKFINSDETKSN